MNKDDNTQNDLAYIPSKYSKALNFYSKYQNKFVLPFLASISKTCDLGSHYPVFKLMKAVSKLFMLNEIEAIFLAYLIRQTHWDIKDKTIFANAQNVQDIVCYSIENVDYKRLILYLMITTFTVKYYLNDNTDELMEEGGKKCPNFKQVFQNWAKKNSSVTTKINPRTLNSVYKKLFLNIRQDSPDFNMMVDAIIQISPAYNPDKQTGKEDKKKSIKIVQAHCKKQQALIKHQKSGFLPAAPLFSSSGILSLAAGIRKNSKQSQNNSGLNPFMPLKNSRVNLGMMGSSVIGVPRNFEINDQDDCNQIMVGLQDGQSEQHIVFDDKNGDEQNINYENTIGLNISKGMTDKIPIQQKSQQKEHN